MKIIPLLVSIIFLASFISPSSFLQQQKNYKRVNTAILEKQKVIDKALQSSGLSSQQFHLLIIAYKEEAQLELYIKAPSQTLYKKLSSYSICSSSGNLGPKKMQGDGQVPEGFYHIDRFNPASSFYLSLGISYPNKHDRLTNKTVNPGGDIFIHGSCVSIGCLPMTDDKIKEIYLYAVHARNNGQLKIPVYIFPFRMTDENFKKHTSALSLTDENVLFWKNLKTGYGKFEKTGTELNVSTSPKGDYMF